jgi:xylulokinase
MLSAAGSLQWYRDTLAPQAGFEALIQEAANISRERGSVFLPYLTGERTPYPDPLARRLRGPDGAPRPRTWRAVLEGRFGLQDSFNLIRQAGLDAIHQVRISGGGAKSPLWQQIIADVLDVELVSVNTTEGAAYGAALLAGVGAGSFKNVPAACQATIRIVGSTQPGPVARLYRDYYPRYQALYPALAEEFKRMAEVVDRQLAGGIPG